MDSPVEGVWIRTFGTAEDAGVLVGPGVSIAPTFPLREIRKWRHQAVFEISIASCGTDGSNLVPSSGESSKPHRRRLDSTSKNGGQEEAKNPGGESGSE